MQGTVYYVQTSLFSLGRLRKWGWRRTGKDGLEVAGRRNSSKDRRGRATAVYEIEKSATDGGGDKTADRQAIALFGTRIQVFMHSKSCNSHPAALRNTRAEPGAYCMQYTSRKLRIWESAPFFRVECNTA